VNAGELRDLVTLQTKHTTRDALNQAVAGWWDAAHVRASVEVLGGRMAHLADQFQEPVTLRVRIRKGPAVNSDWRVIWHSSMGDRTLAVQTVLPTNARDGWDLLCSEGLRDD
jgi:SPP1 family predicted phage head-tail adaptor